MISQRDQENHLHRQYHRIDRREPAMGHALAGLVRESRIPASTDVSGSTQYQSALESTDARSEAGTQSVRHPIQSGRLEIAYGAVPSRLGCRPGPAPCHGRCQANSSKAVVAQNATAAMTSHHSTLVGRTFPLCRRYARATAQLMLQRAQIENNVLMTPLPGPDLGPHSGLPPRHAAT